jgi:hypothetical protein
MPTLKRLETELEQALGRLEKQTTPEAKAEAYLRCIALAAPLLLEGIKPRLPEMDFAIRRGLTQMAEKDPGQIREELEARRDTLKRRVHDSFDDESIPGEAVEDLVALRRERLDREFVTLYWDHFEPRPPSALVVGRFLDQSQVYDDLLPEFPCPIPVVDRLAELSATFHLDGNPLFMPWWDARPDIQKACALLTGESSSKEELDFNLASENYQKEVFAKLEHRLRIGAAVNSAFQMDLALAMAQQGASASARTADAALPLPSQGVMALLAKTQLEFHQGSFRAVGMAAGDATGTAEVYYPKVSLESRRADAELQFKSFEEGRWNFNVKMATPLDTFDIGEGLNPRTMELCLYERANRKLLFREPDRAGIQQWTLCIPLQDSAILRHLLKLEQSQATLFLKHLTQSDGFAELFTLVLEPAV